MRQRCWFATLAAVPLAQVAAAVSPPPLPTIGILAIFKNEAQILAEWLEHHRAEGVSQFVLIDDNSTDGSSDIALAIAERHGTDVTVVPSRAPATGENRQDTSYHAYAPLLRTDWMLVIDLDEFVYARPPLETIPEYLATLDASGPACGAVVMVWQSFTSSGADHQPVSVIDACRERGADLAQTTIDGAFVKTLSRRAALCDAQHSFDLHASITSTPHCTPTRPRAVADQARFQSVNRSLTCADWRRIATADRGSWQNAPEWAGSSSYRGPLPDARDALRINHYSLQSWEFYCRIKMSRGDAVTSLMTRDAILYSLLVDSWTGAVDDELATKRGRAFFDALPRHRPWPPETAADSDCNGAAPASTLLNYSGPKSDASTVRTAATARAAAAAGGHYGASGGRGVRSRRALKSGSTQSVLQPSSSRQL